MGRYGGGLEREEVSKRTAGIIVKKELQMKTRIRILVLFLLVAVVAAYCGPLVTSFTVDYVLGEEASSLPAAVMRWIVSV